MEQQTQTDYLPEPSLGEGFLKEIPEQDRAIVEKYIKDWDAGVTKKFQSIHEEYKPYKTLGSAQELQAAMQLNQYLQEDPVAFFQQLQETLAELEEQGIIMSDFDPGQIPPELPQGLQPTQGQNPAESDRIAQLERQLSELNNNFQQSAQERADAAQMAELDKLMTNLHNTHGAFDDDWVLLQMSRNMSPENAVQSWNKMIEDKVSSSPRKPIPNVMGGGGSIAGNQVDPSKLSASDRVKYIAQMIQSANS